MTDVNWVYTINTLIYTGKGHVAGLVASTTAANGGITLRDGLDASYPKMFQVAFDSAHPFMVFFNDRYSPRFYTGLYLEITAATQITIWLHKIEV